MQRQRERERERERERASNTITSLTASWTKAQKKEDSGEARARAPSPKPPRSLKPITAVFEVGFRVLGFRATPQETWLQGVSGLGFRAGWTGEVESPLQKGGMDQL